MNKEICNKFNEFINSFEVDALEVCVFIYSLFCENGYMNVYYPTGLCGSSVLKGKEE